MILPELELVLDFVESSYTAREGEGPLDVYIELVEGAVERAFPSTVEVRLSSLDISTEGTFHQHYACHA